MTFPNACIRVNELFNCLFRNFSRILAISFSMAKLARLQKKLIKSTSDDVGIPFLSEYTPKVPIT